MTTEGNGEDTKAAEEQAEEADAAREEFAEKMEEAGRSPETGDIKSPKTIAAEAEELEEGYGLGTPGDEDEGDEEGDESEGDAEG